MQRWMASVAKLEDCGVGRIGRKEDDSKTVGAAVERLVRIG